MTKQERVDLVPGMLAAMAAKVRRRIQEGPRGCWLAEGSTNGGYPVVLAGAPIRLSVNADAVLWRERYGRWPAMRLLHKCDVKLCVNPDHLYEGDCRDNALDHLGRPWELRKHG